MYIKANSVESAYVRIVNEIAISGIASAPRGFGIREIINCCIEITNSRDRIVAFPARNFSPAYAFGELLWYISGRNDLGMMQYYSSMMEKFSDNGMTLNSAYGYRIFGGHKQINFDQWENCKSLLTKDPDTRQAIIHLHTPNNKPTKDEVCTLSLQFIRRDNKLNLIVNMRSNDLFLGFTYDAFSFTMLQEMMANELGLELGTYYHNVGSMHLYDDRSGPAIDKLHGLGNGLMQPFTQGHKDFEELIGVENSLRIASVNKSVIPPIVLFDIWSAANKLLEKGTLIEKFAVAAFMIKSSKSYCNSDVFAQSRDDIIDYVRSSIESYADILHLTAGFEKGQKKIVIDGVDGAGKSTLASTFAEAYEGYHVQHYGKPSNNFGYFVNYMYNLSSSVNIIFDRFFPSEIVYWKVFRSNELPKLTDLEIDQLLRKSIEMDVRYVFVIARTMKQLDIIKSRLKFEDMGLLPYIEEINKEYENLAFWMRAKGVEVEIKEVIGGHHG